MANHRLDFTFNGSMSRQVLCNYLSRAVSGLGICSEAKDDLILDENIRFLLRTGTKFVSRAALFAWICKTAPQVEEHYRQAEVNAAKVHAADPEILLQAFVAEIVHKSYVDNLPVPAWVFEAFGEEPQQRNFVFEDMIDLKKGPDYWGEKMGYPDWSRPEAQRWYYYCIIRYIDIGYESIHIQEADEIDGQYNPVSVEACDRVLTMARAYAKTHARRGVVLFHNFFSMIHGGCRVGERLLFDINGNGLVPNETQYNEQTGAYECRISYPDGEYWCTWLGRSRGGLHPLGFTVETCPTLLEFDNFGQQGPLNVSNGPAFGTWGYDDISWFATQPEAYRNHFLRYIEQYTTENCLSKEGERQYYISFPMRRCLTATPNDPQAVYKPGAQFSEPFLRDYTEWDNVTCEALDDGTYRLTTVGYYIANRMSDGCPNGFNQEDTIRAIFLGDDSPEDAKWDTIVLPAGYTAAVK